MKKNQKNILTLLGTGLAFLLLGILIFQGWNITEEDKNSSPLSKDETALAPKSKEPHNIVAQKQENTLLVEGKNSSVSENNSSLSHHLELKNTHPTLRVKDLALKEVISFEKRKLVLFRANSSINSEVRDFAQFAEKTAISPREILQQFPFSVKENSVLLEVRVKSSSSIPKSSLENFGAQIAKKTDGALSVWFPIDSLGQLDKVEGLTQASFLAKVVPSEELYLGDSVSEAVSLLKARSWHDQGFTGKGVKIGIIDVGFGQYISLQGKDLPGETFVKNFVDGESDLDIDLDGQKHGTACAEIIHDLAPDAQLYLAKVSNHFDIEKAVEWFISQGVQIISSSIGDYNQAPGDGTGTYAKIVAKAQEKDILWVTAAGNDAENHWSGLFSDIEGNSLHNFQDGEVNFFGPGDGTMYMISSGQNIRMHMRWDDWDKVDQDYDLEIVRYDLQQQKLETLPQFGGSNQQNGVEGQKPTENAFAMTTGEDAFYGFRIRRVQGNEENHFNVFAPKFRRFHEISRDRSLADLADIPAVLTVAALDVKSQKQESYSSQGPTNGPGGSFSPGFIKPDLAAFANVLTQSYGKKSKFNGTSAATPHVAGVAALILNSRPTYTGKELKKNLLERAIDLGESGKDTLFGKGQLHLGSALKE